MTPIRREQWLAASLALLAAVGVGAVVATSHDITTSEQRSRPGNLFSAFYESEVARIEITRFGDESSSVVLERPPAPRTDADSERPWRLVEPIVEEADVAAVKRLLTALRHAAWVRRASTDASRSALGLDSPWAALRVTMAAASYELRVGKESPRPAGSRYVEISGEGVPNAGIYVVARTFFDEVWVSPDTLRERKLVPYSAADLARVEMLGAGGPRRMVQRPDRAWYFDGQNAGSRLERDAVERIFLQLDRARADRFVDAKQADEWLGGGGERVQLVLTPKDAASPPARIDIGGACAAPPGSEAATESYAVVVRRSPEPVAACVSSSVMVGLTVDADTLASRHVSRLRRDEVEELRIEVPDPSAPDTLRRLELIRTQGGYRLRAPSEGEVPPDIGDERIASVVDLQGEPTGDVVDDEPLLATVTLKPAGDAAPDVVRFRGRAGESGRLWAVREADSVALRLPPGAEAALRVDGSLLRSLDVLSFDRSLLREVAVSGAIEQVVRYEKGGGLELARPEGFEVDGTTATTLAQTVSSLTARRWVSDEREPGMGFDAPTLRARMHLDDPSKNGGERRLELVVGARTSGGYFAALASDPAVFVIDERSVQALSAWAIRRSVFDVHWPEARSVTLAARGGHISLRRIGSGMVASTTLSVAMADLERAMADLVPEFALHPGPARGHEGFDTPVLRVEARGARTVEYVIGARDVYLDTLGYYARAGGTDATFFVPAARVRAVLAAF